MNKYLPILFLLLKINYLFSQSSEGEIEDAQILIEKNSLILLPKVDKTINKVSLENKNISKKTFDFKTIDFKDLVLNNKIDKIIKDNTSYLDYDNTFIDIRAGNYSSYLFHTNPNYKLGNKLAIYSDIYVKLNSKGSKLGKLSGENINDLNFLIDYKYNVKSKLSSHINYRNYENGYYGFTNIKDLILDDNEINNLKLFHNSFYYNIDWETVNNNFYWKLYHSGKLFKDLLNNEFDNNYYAEISYKFKNNIISFKPTLNIYSLRINNSVPSLVKKTNFNKFEIPLIFNYNSNNFDLRIKGSYKSLTRNYKNQISKSFFAPELKLKYSLNNISFRISGSRDIYFNKYSRWLNLMPYIYSPLVINQFDINTEFFRIISGIDFRIIKNTTISIDYQSVKQKGSLDYRIFNGSELPLDSNNPEFLYTLVRNNDKEIINYLTLSFKSILSQRFESSFSLLYTMYEQDDIFQPLYVINFLNTYSINNLSVSLGGLLELENYGLNLKNELFLMNSYVDLFIDSSYKISDNLIFNIRINNILNRYNERYFMYPDLGVNFIGGLKWEF